MLKALNEKPPVLIYKAFSVAGVDEPLARRSLISNFDLVRDMAEVADFLINFE